MSVDLKEAIADRDEKEDATEDLGYWKSGS